MRKGTTAGQKKNQVNVAAQARAEAIEKNGGPGSMAFLKFDGASRLRQATTGWRL